MPKGVIPAMLDNFELIQMRADLQGATLPDTCNIQSATKVADGMGGFTITWATARAGVACRVDAQSGHESLVGGQIAPYHRFTLTVPQDTTLTTAHRVTHAGVTYNVISVSDGSWIACKRAVLEKV